MKDKQIKMYIDGKEVDFTDFTNELSDFDYAYKENGNWYIHKKPIKDNKIEKIDFAHPNISCSYNESEILCRVEAIQNKINEIIEVLNERRL